MTTLRQSKQVYHIVEQGTGEVLSRHKHMNGRNGAKSWLKGWRAADFKVAVHYRPSGQATIKQVVTDEGLPATVVTPPWLVGG